MAKRKAPRAGRRGKSTRLRKASARQARGRKASARQARGRKATARRPRKVARKAVKKRAVARKTVARKDTRKGSARVTARKAPALDRERRIAREEDMVPTPPSSLDLDRTASAARSGRRELHERVIRHNETSPAITGGDIDADWESAYAVGDEAPGGDNPTPDQDIVDDIGRALGVEYEDNEELKGEKKISDRDKKRWELDPASSDDFDDR